MRSREQRTQHLLCFCPPQVAVPYRNHWGQREDYGEDEAPQCQHTD